MLAASAWCQEAVSVDSVDMPELVWNTNSVAIILRNHTAQPQTVILDVQARNHRGTGWQTEHILPANEAVPIDREFTMPPFPGNASVVIAVREKDGTEIYQRKFETMFALENKRIGKLHVPQSMIERNPYRPSPLAAEYPPLEMAHRGHFVFYYPANFAYVRDHLDVLAKTRERVYRKLQKTLNLDFHDDVAVYLFPDGPTKFAYTGHQGQGWAFDHVLVEIFDPAHSSDPNRVDPNHELVHIVTGPLGDPPAMFHEGLATYLQVEHKWQGYTVDDWSRSFDRAGMLMPIVRLFALDDIGSKGTQPWVTYPESASMMEYLSKHYGLHKMMQAYRQLKSSAPEQQNAAVFEQLFGINVDTFEKSWRNKLRKESSGIPDHLLEEIRAKIVDDEK